MRARVVIVRGGEVALIERVREGRTYYVFPGGGAEPGESPEDAAVREAFEELGVRVVLRGLLAVIPFAGGEQYFYAAEVAGGAFGAGAGEEFTAERAAERGSYRPVWVSAESLPSIDVRPRAVADLIRCGVRSPTHG
jgi:8-oxo-dGTP pyrophosphatase MutT (NUDIX family)